MRGWDRSLDLVEAVYRLDGTDAEWMRGIVEAAARVFRHDGLGAAGFMIEREVDEVGRAKTVELTAPHVETSAIKAPADWRRIIGSWPVEVQSGVCFSSTLVSTLSTRTWVRDDLPTWVERSGWDSSVTKDALGVACHEGTNVAAFIGVGLKAPVALKDGERRLGERLAMHAGAALRLRRAGRKSPEAAEAVLSAKGRMEHLAPGTDGAAVKDGIARRSRARSGFVTAEKALEIWQGLHDGRWSLVDFIDTDGKAFVLAVRNEPAREVASSLSDRQRAVVALAALGYGNKQIAYALGLSTAAVAMLIRRARGATGAQSRAELVRAFKRSLASSP